MKEIIVLFHKTLLQNKTTLYNKKKNILGMVFTGINISIVLAHHAKGYLTWIIH